MKRLLGLRSGLAAAVIVLASISTPASADSLDQITVQAQRETLRKQVDQFFHSAMLKPLFDESLLRWEDAVCPMVVGMIRPAGEFVLRRISELARESGVPLAKENCKHPNLYIIVAKNPETFLKLWWRHQPRMYNTGRGIAPVRRFIEKSRPVRVWYNIGSGNYANEISGLLAASVDAGLGTVDYPIVRGPSSGASLRLVFPDVRSIGSAIVIIDPAQVDQLNIGQFADYIAMVSFVEVNQDAGHLKSEHMEVSMAGNSRRHIGDCVILIALASLSPSADLKASELPTTEDQVAEHEFAIAKPELVHMNHVLDVEMKRLTLEAGGAPSLEAEEYLNVSPTKLVDLGDVQIPLHTRFIERQRRSWMNGISFAKASMSEHCDSPDPPPDQLLDASVRAKVLAALKCHQRRLDRYQTGMRQANQQYTAMLVELKLPPHTQQKMLDEAIQSEMSGNVELSHNLAGQRRSLQANLDFISFLDAHAQHARYLNNELVFDDPAESKEFRELAVGARIESMSLRK